MQSTETNSAQEFSLVVFGHDVIRAAIPYLRLKQLKLVAASAHLDKLTFDSRVRSLSNSGIHQVDSIARHGFFFIPCNASASSDIVCCVYCSSRVALQDYETAVESSKAHQRSCLYFTFLTDEGDRGPSTTDAEQDNNLLIHLRQQLSKSRTFVMEEMGYSKDFVCVVLTRRFLLDRPSFTNAGELVDALNDMEDSLGEEFAQKLLPGIAGFIISFPLPLRASLPPPEAEPPAPDVILDKQKRYELLRRETLKLLLMTKCKGCKTDANVEFVALPCSHFCLCSSCARKLSKCPICSEEIHDLVKTYGP